MSAGLAITIRKVNKQHQQQNHDSESGGCQPRLLFDDQGEAGKNKNCSREIRPEQASRNPCGRQFAEGNPGREAGMENVLALGRFVFLPKPKRPR